MFGVGLVGDFNNYVEDGFFGVGIEGDVVEGGDGDVIFFDVYVVFEGVGGVDFVDGVGYFVEWLIVGGCGEVLGNLGCLCKRLL